MSNTESWSDQSLEGWIKLRKMLAEHLNFIFDLIEDLCGDFFYLGLELLSSLVRRQVGKIVLFAKSSR